MLLQYFLQSDIPSLEGEFSRSKGMHILSFMLNKTKQNKISVHFEAFMASCREGGGHTT